MTDIAFEHFDPEVELGNLDENGRPIRPRKKPGRKPNPPSPAQRKAQNRAAQRAFRERKRREMREAEATVKKCLYIRDQAMREARALRRKNEQLQYENNYLRGLVLTLKLACHAARVDVPNYADMGDRDDLGGEKHMESNCRDIPQPLAIFLDKNRHIVSLDQDNLPSDLSPQMPPASMPSLSSTSTNDTNGPYSQSMIESMLMSPSIASGGTSMPGAFDISDVPPPQPLPPLDLTQTMSVLGPQIQAFNNSHQIDPAFFQQLLHTDLMSGFIDQLTRPNFTIDQTPPELAALIPPEWRTSLENYSNSQGIFQRQQQQQQHQYQQHQNIPNAYNIKNEPIFNNYSNCNASSRTQAPINSMSPQSQPMSDTPSPVHTADTTMSSAQEERKVYPPMSPLQYVELMRSERKLDKRTRAFFTPTELQRKIPHDIRIDVVPGAVMRDQMILFQDFYDANELFNFLINTSMFLGGSPGNQDDWFVPPAFLRKYWFLIPNHKPPNRLDNVVEIVVYLGQKLQEQMLVRKRMYFEKEKYADHFPAPITASLEPESSDDMKIEGIPEQDNAKEDESEEGFVDLPENSPLDVVIGAMESMPRLTSPDTLPF